MAFNFYGTYSTGQYNQFYDFSKVQEADIKSRIRHLEVLITKYGRFTVTYDPETGNPIQIICSGNNSYGAKLLNAYKILGGVPEKDFLLRTNSDPVYLKPGPPVISDPQSAYVGFGSQYSDNRLDRGTLVYDRDLGELVLAQKRWQLEIIKRKRESLEYKIKRVLYLSQQLEEERRLLTSMLEETNANNLNVISAKIRSAQLEPGRMSVVSNDQDIFGLFIGREYDSANPGEEGAAEARGERGVPT